MVTNLRDVKKALILAPHPDDEALGCSGTILILKEEGATASIIYITNGERLYGSASKVIAEERIKEACRACSLLGVKDYKFLGLPDGDVINFEMILLEKLEQIIKQNMPDLIFSPSPIDYHPDHIAIANVSMKLLKNLKSFNLAFYEIYSTIKFSHLIDITKVIEQKKSIIMNYQRSLYNKPEVYVHALLGLNAQRSIFTQRKGFYEAFKIIDPLKDSIDIQIDKFIYL